MTIEIKNLNKQYNNILAVKNINFKINKGSIVGLLGPNGCGKTQCLGSVFINGQNIENENNRTKILEKVNFISHMLSFQKNLRLKKILKFMEKMYGVNNLKDKISDLMKQLNLLDLKKENW